jgi:formylglycine-generating enzyme
MSWRHLGSTVNWPLCQTRASAFAVVGAIGLLPSCTGEPSNSPAVDCADDAQAGLSCAPEEGGCHCTSLVDLPPVAAIRFQLQMPTSPSDYPYGPDASPPETPIPGSTVYLSAAGTTDPEGAPFGVFWNVQDPSAAYLPIDPSPNAVDVSFSPPRIGAYTVTLEATEKGGLHQTATATLTLQVEPHPCAPDGFSPPCSDALPVPGGSFLMGSADDVGYDNERPQHLALIAPFLLDKYEVTVGRFRRFVADYEGPPTDGAGANPLIPNSGWMAVSFYSDISPDSADLVAAIENCGGTWTASAGPGDARPITCVSWYDAFAFCIWDGKRLPTEAEWEYAAAGGSEQRIYPWGQDPPNAQRAVYGCLFSGAPGCSAEDLPVVGSLPLGAGRWGQLDLAGSVWEWTLDMYAAYTTDPCDNCATLSVTTDLGRVFRGGDYSFADPSSLRAASRLSFDPLFPDPARGFRCAL